MNFNEYQYKSQQTAIYPEAGQKSLAALTYVSLGLTNEAGEVAGKTKKLLRDGDTPEKRTNIVKELGDVIWYVSQLCTELDIPLDYVAQQNIDKLADRKERGVIQGNGDER